MSARPIPREPLLQRNTPPQEIKLSAEAEKAYRSYRSQLSAASSKDRKTAAAAKRRHGYLGQPLVVSTHNTTSVKVNHMNPGNVSYATTVPVVVKSLSAAPFLAEDLDNSTRDFLRRYAVGDKSLPSESFLYNELYNNMHIYTHIVDDVTRQCKRAFHKKASRHPEDESYLAPERQQQLARVVAACGESQSQTCVKRRSELEAMHREKPIILARRAALNAQCFEYSVPHGDIEAHTMSPCKEMTHTNAHPYLEMRTQYGDRFVKRVLVAHAFEDALHASAFGGDIPQDSITAAPTRHWFAFRTPKYKLRDTTDIAWNARTRSFGTGGPQLEWMQLVRRMYDVRRLHNVRAACSDVRKRAEVMAQGQRAGNNFTRHSNRYADLLPSQISLILSKMALPTNLGVTEYGYVCADPVHPHDSEWNKSYTRFGRATVCSDITEDEMQLPFGGYTDSSANNASIQHSSYQAIIRDHLLSVFINQVGINIAQTNPGLGTQGRYGHVQTMRLGQQSPEDVLHALQATRMFSYRTADNKAVSNVDAPWILQGATQICALLGPSIVWQMRNAKRLIIGTRAPNWEETYQNLKEQHDGKSRTCNITHVRGLYGEVQGALESKCQGTCAEYSSVRKARLNYSRVLDQIRKLALPNARARANGGSGNAGGPNNKPPTANNRNARTSNRNTAANNEGANRSNATALNGGANRQTSRNANTGVNTNNGNKTKNAGASTNNGNKTKNLGSSNKNANNRVANNRVANNGGATNRVANNGGANNRGANNRVANNRVANNGGATNRVANNGGAKDGNNARKSRNTTPTNRGNMVSTSEGNAAPIGNGLTKSMRPRDNILLDQNVVLVDGEIYNNCAPTLSFLLWSGNNDVLGISERTHIGAGNKFHLVIPPILPLDVTAPTFSKSVDAARQMVRLLRKDAHSGVQGLVERLHENVVKPLIQTGQITKAMHFDDLVRRWRIVVDGVNDPVQLIKITSQPQNYKMYKCLLFYLFSHAGFSTPQALEKIREYEQMTRVRESQTQMLEVTASLRMMGDSGPMPHRLFTKIVDHSLRAVPHKPTLSQGDVQIEYSNRVRRATKPHAAMGGAASWINGLGSFSQRYAASKNASRNARATGKTRGPQRPMATGAIPALESRNATMMRVNLGKK